MADLAALMTRFRWRDCVLTRQDAIYDADGARDAAAKGGKCGDDRYGDQCSGYRVLNCGQTLFVSEEIHDLRFHLYYL